MASSVFLRLFAVVLFFSGAASTSFAGWSVTPEQRYAHNAALAEMRSRADGVADAYFDLADAHAANAPAATLTDLRNTLGERLKIALLVQSVGEGTKDFQDKLLFNHGTGLESKILIPWMASDPQGYVTTRNTLVTSAIGALILGAIYALDQAHVFPDVAFYYGPMLGFTSLGIGVGAFLSASVSGPRLSDVKKECWEYPWRYKRHLLLSAFLGQLKARQVPLEKGSSISLPNINHINFNLSDAILDATTYRPFLAGVSDEHGRLSMDNLYNEGRNVRGWVEHWIAALDRGITDAGTMERPVLESLRTQWQSKLSALSAVTALLQLKAETTETATAIPALSAALASLGTYAFVKYENPIIRSKPGDNSVAGAITAAAIRVHPDTQGHTAVVFRRARIASAELVAAFARLIPPTVSTAPDTAGRVNYRTPDHPAAEPTALSDLSLGNFANAITFTVTNLQHRVTATRARVGLHKLQAKLTIHRRDNKTVDIPVSLEFNSTQSNDRVLSHESSWIAPLNEALVSAVNAMADSRIINDAEEFAPASDVCEGAATPVPPARVEVTESDDDEDAATDEEAASARARPGR